MDITKKREEMNKEAWIINVLRIHPEKTREEAEALHDKIFGYIGPMSGLPCEIDPNNPDKVIPV